MKRKELPYEIRRKIRTLERETDRLMNAMLALCYIMGALVIAAEIACIIAAVG